MSDSLLTPQQTNFLKYYTDPTSETFSNAYMSAKKAEYSEEYSQNITGQMPDWLSENISDTRLLKKANKNLDMALDGLLDDPEKGGKPLQMKATELTLKGLHKNKWSDRTEITGKGGESLTVNVVQYKDANTG